MVIKNVVLKSNIGICHLLAVKIHLVFNTSSYVPSFFVRTSIVFCSLADTCICCQRSGDTSPQPIVSSSSSFQTNQCEWLGPHQRMQYNPWSAFLYGQRYCWLLVNGLFKGRTTYPQCHVEHPQKEKRFLFDEIFITKKPFLAMAVRRFTRWWGGGRAKDEDQFQSL